MKKQLIKFFFLLAVLFIGCQGDLYTKQLALDDLKHNPAMSVIKGFMEFSYTENKGMVFGLFGTSKSDLKNYILISLTSVVILYVIFLIWRMRNLPFFYHFPFFLILSGAFGNLIDRIRYGRVIDFIHIHWKEAVDWPFLFNVADVLICFGEVLIILLLIFKRGVIERTVFNKIRTDE